MDQTDTNQGGRSLYRINRHDEISYVDPNYEEFAQYNDGAGCRAAVVLNQSLWQFITDATTQHLYKILLQRVRAGREVSFRIRCDSPGVRRLLQIRVIPASDGDVEFHIQPLWSEPRSFVPLLAASSARSAELLRLCGWCKQVDVGDHWEEVEVAVQRLNLFHEGPLPRLTHGICEPCHRAMLQTLDET